MSLTKLQLAQQKLQSTDVPLALRVIAVIILVRTRGGVGAVPPRRGFTPAPRPNPREYGYTYYLRLACTALGSQGMRYTTLLQALSHHNSDWLSTCTVTEAGMLKSSDRTINQILKPFKALHQGSTTVIPEMAIAA